MQSSHVLDVSSCTVHTGPVLHCIDHMHCVPARTPDAALQLFPHVQPCEQTGLNMLRFWHRLLSVQALLISAIPSLRTQACYSGIFTDLRTNRDSRRQLCC